MRQIHHNNSSWQLARAFIISRGAKTQADVIQVAITEDDQTGMGECVPYARYGETLASVAAQIDSIAAQLAEGLSREDLQPLLPAGAARNAIDCALWDLEAKLSGQSVSQRSKLAAATELVSAQTLSIDTPEEMAKEAMQHKNCPLIKVKLDANQVVDRMRAVNQVAPDSKFIIDANEAWSLELLNSISDDLESLGVTLIEQPLAADKDEDLVNYHGNIALCADESCHTHTDIPKLANRYQAINIKLDKTGGLTEAIHTDNLARKHNMQVMVGCMVGTSLAMAPATLLAANAEYVDLDGPALLAEDVANGFRFNNGTMSALDPRLWGSA